MTDFTPRMNRSVMQLMYTYLPGRTVDWENGEAIVVLDSPRLEDVWTPVQSKIVLDEVGRFVERWRARGRTDDFPDPTNDARSFVVGTPLSINAKVLMTALWCYRCSHIVFRKRAYMASRKSGVARTRCPRCRTRTLRQFGLVFVHGCGRIEPLTQEISRVDRDGTPKKRAIWCTQCRSDEHLELRGESDRASGLTVLCSKCRTLVLDRLSASCPDCARRIVREAGGDVDASALRIQTLMRITRHSAREAYYPHTLTVMRLGRTPIISEPDAEMALLQELLPADARARIKADAVESIEELLARVRRAEREGNAEEKRSLMTRIAHLATQPESEASVEKSGDMDGPGLLVGAAPDMHQAVLESQALLECVHMTPALEVAKRSGGASGANVDEAATLLGRLGIRRLDVVEDLPIVSAAFAYSRRSGDPDYEELGRKLPTFLRPLTALDDRSALTADRRDIVGKHPILARESEHEGILFTLDEMRVRLWLRANGVEVPEASNGRAAILRLLEQVDRYYDNIWELPVRRLLFGLIHSLSHAAMRAASFFSGLDRTSIGEYLFIPLLGAVIYANSATFKMGGMEALVRDHLASFLVKLQEEAVTCLYDPDCLDRLGACHGCIHSPDIACRVFNHGLSRAFLLGGKAPWAPHSDQRLVGYWELASA